MARGSIDRATRGDVLRELLLLCPAGLEQVVSRVAESDLPGFEARGVSSGYVRGVARASASLLRAFRCATNSFFVVASVQRTNLAREQRLLVHALERVQRPRGIPLHATFRLRIHSDGRFAPTTDGGANDLEAAIAAWSGLNPSRRGAPIEVWVIRRIDQPEVLLATKLSKGSPRVTPGTLRPEVAAALARIEPLKGRTVLDPFAGSGAIGAACLDAGAKHVWLNDYATSPRVPHRGIASNITVTRRDFRSLPVEDGAIDVIVTDPPWGHFNQPQEGTVKLYEDLGRAAARWLPLRGGLVMLSGAPRVAVARLLQVGSFQVLEELPVLINGRKAVVINATKT